MPLKRVHGHFWARSDQQKKIRPSLDKTRGVFTTVYLRLMSKSCDSTCRCRTRTWKKVLVLRNHRRDIRYTYASEGEDPSG